MLQTMLEVGHPVSQHPASQHGAKNRARRINLILLEPPEIKNSVVRDPPALNTEELLQVNPVVVVQLKTVDDHRRLPVSRQLEQPQPPKSRLEPGGLNVKCNSGRTLQSRKVLNAKENFHAW